ncbi:MAG TPA: hypothetical protein VJG30_00305 [Candidatus Nanoarchaeia archaeon]|nr:hypothetical protein [Candidatus Nanoarchaeia archaeon]
MNLPDNMKHLPEPRRLEIRVDAERTTLADYLLIPVEVAEIEFFM